MLCCHGPEPIGFDDQRASNLIMGCTNSYAKQMLLNRVTTHRSRNHHAKSLTLYSSSLLSRGTPQLDLGIHNSSAVEDLQGSKTMMYIHAR
jgi:hypothetical protein